MRSFLVLSGLFALLTAHLAPANRTVSSEADLDTTVRPIREKLRRIAQTKDSTPEKYVSESIACAEELSAVAERFKAVSQSVGVRGEAVSQLMKTADFVRRKMRDPRRAITIYTRAAAIHTEQYPWTAGTAMHEQIADIYEYDLADYAAAANTLRTMRATTQRLPASQRQDYAAVSQWTLRWLDAEIAFLEKGTPYEGSVSEADVRAFSQNLVFGMGRETTNGDSLGPDLDVHGETRTLTAESRNHLFALTPSHSTFLRTWMVAARLSRKEDARRWLNSNDKAGFWRACLLTLAAIADREASLRNSSKSLTAFQLVRTVDGKPNGFALLARDFATRNPLPKVAR
jgi:hypothetical protein